VGGSVEDGLFYGNSREDEIIFFHLCRKNSISTRCYLKAGEFQVLV
jgi:hypothetical protein